MPTALNLSEKQLAVLSQVLHNTICEWEAWGPDENMPLEYTTNDLKALKEAVDCAAGISSPEANA